MLPNKSMANIARCILKSADKSNLSRFLSEAPWREGEGNRRRIRFILQQTTPHRYRRRESLVVIDDTCANMWEASSTTWTGTITPVMTPFPWLITRSRACL